MTTRPGLKPARSAAEVVKAIADMDSRLTTRRVDKLTVVETNMLVQALRGPLWVITGTRSDWDAAFNLQRFGHFAPTNRGRTDKSGNYALGWQLTQRGLRALERLFPKALAA